MFTQIEITTACNAACFYCPNDTLKSEHMAQECFEHILKEEKQPTTLLLHGMGEPLLHPFFWEMVLYAKQRSHQIRIMTNGSIALNPTHLCLLDHIGFSLDTLNEDIAKQSGRPSPQKVLKNLLACHQKAPRKITIYSVNYQQNLEPLKQFAKEHQIPLKIQPLQTKKSYQAHYETTPLEYKTFECPYLENEKMKFYFVNGTKAPCSFMIDSSKVLHDKVIQHNLARNTVPSCCTQCTELTGVRHP